MLVLLKYPKRLALGIRAKGIVLLNMDMLFRQKDFVPALFAGTWGLFVLFWELQELCLFSFLPPPPPGGGEKKKKKKKTQ